MERATKFLLFLVFNLPGVCWAASAQNIVYKVDQPSSEVSFLAVGKPSLIKIKGQGARPTGSFTVANDNISGEFFLELNELKTGIAMRDTHMKEKYLESNKLENAKALLKVGKVNRACLLEVSPASGKTCDFEGELTLHGKTQAIKGLVSAKKSATGLSVSANFSTKISDYGIKIPSFAGVTVADEVVVSADLSARQ